MTSIGFGSYARADIEGSEIRAAWGAEGFRRVLNVVAAGLALILVAPIILIIGLLIRLTSRGPILSAQMCVGIDRRCRKLGILDHRRSIDAGGTLITIYKFRTTTVGSRSRAPYVTWLGGFLQRSRLDELPQLFNVLRGDMNLVGPRPQQPRIFARLRDCVERYTERQRVLPGITGLAQVQDHYYAPVEDVVKTLRFDLEYVARRSAAQDCKIMLRTLPAVLMRKEAS